MKLFICDGRGLTVRDAGPVIFRLGLGPSNAPIKMHGIRLLADNEAREALRGLLDTGLYVRGQADGEEDEGEEP